MHCRAPVCARVRVNIMGWPAVVLSGREGGCEEMGEGGGCGVRRRSGVVGGGDGRVGVKRWGEGVEGGNGRPVMHIMERCCAVDVRCKDRLVHTGWREVVG